jgi:hypothetical protein
MKILSVFVALLLIASGVVYVSERSATHARIADNPLVWFVTLKYDSDAQEFPFVESGHKIEWRGRADSVFIGSGPPLAALSERLLEGNQHQVHRAVASIATLVP